MSVTPVRPCSFIHLVGDSTLDDIFWKLKDSDKDALNAKRDSVEGVLQSQVTHEGHIVLNHAYDGFTTQSVLWGDQAGKVLPSQGRRKRLYMQERVPRRTFVYPLTNLGEQIAEKPQAHHFVVLSVGGNDFRQNLQNPIRFLQEVSQIQKRYLQIVREIRSIPEKNVHPILMFQYRTDANCDHYRIYPLLRIIGIAAAIIHVSCLGLLTVPLWLIAGKVSGFLGISLFLAGAAGLFASTRIIPLSVTKDALFGKQIAMSVLGSLMKSFYKPILEFAKTEHIPVLDLPNTFNPYRDLYECGIEPGKKGSQLIAEGIHHVVNHHNFTKPSALYSKPDNQPSYAAEPNTDPAKWHVAYPSNPGK